MGQPAKKFEFYAFDSHGKEVHGTVKSASQEGALKLISQNGLKLERISEQQAFSIKKLLPGNFAHREITLSDLKVFVRKFVTLIEAGVAIIDSLKLMAKNSENPELKEKLEGIAAEIEAGTTLHRALARYPRIFDNTFVHLVKAGETSGTLAEALLFVAKSLEKKESLNNKIKSAMFYPIFIIILSIAMIAVMLTFVIPGMQTLFLSSNQQLPTITLALLKASKLFKQFWWAGLILVGVFIFLFKKYRATSNGRRKTDQWLLQIPLLGKIHHHSEIIRFAQSVGPSLSAGVTIIDSLYIGRDVLKNVVLVSQIHWIVEKVKAGETLAQTFADADIFPNLVNEMITVGEKTGALDVMFQKITEFYEEEVDNAIKGAMSLIEPILLVGIGAVIATILIAMYMPIFSMANIFG